MNDITYTTASYSFKCPITGAKVQKGDRVAWNKENGYMSIEALNEIEL